MMNHTITKLIHKSLKNKLVWFSLSRYAVYGTQFIVSMLCAAKMGPYYYGLWGFALMLLSYMQRLDLGIANAMNVILVQEKDNHEEFARTQTTGFLLIGILVIGVILFAFGNSVFGYAFLEKYPLGGLFYIVCATAVISYYVAAGSGIYRVKQKLTEIAVVQSIITLLLLLSLFIAKGKELLMWFTLSYLLGNFLSLIIYLTRGGVTLTVSPSRIMANRILKKGFFLFLYNASFYFILISTRTIISQNYPVEQFGYFTFAFSLADAVILLLSSISFLIFPKTIAKLKSSNLEEVQTTLKMLRTNYIALTHGMMYVAFLAFPIMTFLIPKYEPSLHAIYMVGLALITNTISFGYSYYLMAQNKDKQLALIALISLIVNIVIALFLVKIIKCTFEYVMFATIMSYFVFSVLCIILGLKQMDEKITFSKVLRESYPGKLLIPFVSSIFVFFIDSYLVLLLPLIVFLIFNKKTVKEIYQTLIRLIDNPNILEIKISEKE